MKKALIYFFATFVFLLAFPSSELHARRHKTKPPKRERQINDDLLVNARGFMVHTNAADIGFGAVVVSLIPVLDRFDTGKHDGVKVNLDTGCYLDLALGPNWWNYYFEPIDMGNQAAPRHVINKKEALALYQSGARIPRIRCCNLLQRYVLLRSELQTEIADFCARKFQGHYVIGVHHRGTDKKTEVPIVSFDRTLQSLQQLVEALNKDVYDNLRIFVATDDAQFLNEVMVRYPSKVVFNDFVRSTNGKPLHLSQDMYGTNYQKGKEAIIDCYLLSKCDHLIYPSASSFSHLSTLLNASMKITPLHPWVQENVYEEIGPFYE